MSADLRPASAALATPAREAASPQPAPLECDVLVVGGGINGCGIARDLAGRGWRVVLAERDDLAAHTSSASTKLIHGGLRYLEHREFLLVRKALQERERLMRSAPHLMWPLGFVLPHDASMRPAWLIRAGLFLYDHLARRDWLPASRAIDLAAHPAGTALAPRLQRGFLYSDGWVDDARLVVACAIDARERGATVLTRTACTEARRTQDAWHATLRGPSGTRPVRARALVNAAGPWADEFLRAHVRPARGEALATRALRLVKGSHIVVPKLFDHAYAYLFQNPDGRILFAIPYEHDYTLIGTTDKELHDDPGATTADADEIAYLCAQASRWLARPVTPADVRWSYAGVRPLLDDHDGSPSAVTRDYLLETHADGAPLLTVWGGKITTFRRLAEEASDLTGRLLGETQRAAWTDGAPLPGGDLAPWIGPPGTPAQDFARFVQVLRERHPGLPAALLHRYARAYGARIGRLLGGARDTAALGPEIAPGLHEAELRHLVHDEWATCADDVLWRRSKLGLHLDAAGHQAVASWFAQVTSAEPGGTTGLPPRA